MSSANLRLLSPTPLMLIPVSMFILMKIFSTAAVNITGDNVSNLTYSFHDFNPFTELFCFYLCCSFGVCFFDDVNVLLLYAMCPKCFEDCSMLDGIEGLFIVNESHVEWNVVILLNSLNSWSLVVRITFDALASHCR